MLRSTDKLSELLTQIAYHRSQLDLYMVQRLEVEVKELEAIYTSRAKSLVLKYRAAANADQELEALHVSNAKRIGDRHRAAAALRSTPPASLPVLQPTSPKVKRASRLQPGRIHLQPGRIHLQPGRIHLQQPGRIHKKLTLEQKAVRAAAQRLRRFLSR